SALSLHSATLRNSDIPALFTRMSTGPGAASACCTTAARDVDGSRRSAASATARPPAALIAANVPEREQTRPTAATIRAPDPTARASPGGHVTDGVGIGPRHDPEVVVALDASWRAVAHVGRAHAGGPDHRRGRQFRAVVEHDAGGVDRLHQCADPYLHSSP